MRVFRVVAIVAVLAVTGSGCGLFGDDEGSGGESGPLDGLWVVVEIDGQPIVVGDNTQRVPYVEVAGGDLAGTFGCGESEASFTIGDVSLMVDTLTAPTEPCDSVAVSFAENAMMDVLTAEEVGYTVAEDERMVWVAAGRQIIFETSAEPPSS